MNQTAEKLDQSKLKAKAPADGSRRYKKGVFPAYDKEYLRLATRSKILNPDNNRRDFANAFSGTGIGECQRDLLELTGNEDNRYKREGTWYSALIPAAKENLKEVHRDFKRYQQQQVRSGQSLQPPKEWPEGMLTERLKAEARLDVRRREKDLLEERIEHLKEQQGKTVDEPMLPDGPVGNFSERYINRVRKKSLLDSVDGQSIGYSAQGVPYINDEDSPYFEMPIATYRKMSKQWMKENRIRTMDIVERRNEYRQKMQDEGLADELPVNFTYRKFENMIKGKTKLKGQENWPKIKPWPEMPEWPEDAQPISELEAELHS